MALEEKINAALKKIKDPELGFDLLTLGLIYDLQINDGTVVVAMTLTFPGCPWGPELMAETKKAISSVDGVKKVTINLTFDPPWDISRIDADARLSLGLK